MAGASPANVLTVNIARGGCVGVDGWRGEGIAGPVKVEYGRAVWLQLDVAFPPPSRPRSTADGIDLRGRVPAVLKRWVCSHDGAWYGLLHPVEFRDGAGVRRLVVAELLVRAAALQSRD